LAEAHKAKIAAALRGRVRPPETVAKMAAAAMGNKHCVGRKMSPKTRELIGVAQKGNKHSLGLKRSEEWRRGVIERMKGNTNKLGQKDSAATRARKAAANVRRSGGIVLPSLLPGMMGFCPRYDLNRIVFYCP
jgi:hypothetical protein